MARALRILFFGFIFACGVGAQAASPASQPTTQDALKPHLHRVRAGQADATGWFPATGTELPFSICLPAQFSDFSMATSAADGVGIHTHILGTTTAAGVRFAAVAMVREDGKFPNDPIATFADGFKQKGELHSQKTVCLCGIDRTQFDVGNSRSCARFHLFQKDGVLYQLIIESPKPDFAPLELDATRFFSSFQFPSTATTRPQ
jgi:hypothetical protein